jgi:hypothetical protein
MKGCGQKVAQGVVWFGGVFAPLNYRGEVGRGVGGDAGELEERLRYLFEGVASSNKEAG